MATALLLFVVLLILPMALLPLLPAVHTPVAARRQPLPRPAALPPVPPRDRAA